MFLIVAIKDKHRFLVVCGERSTKGLYYFDEYLSIKISYGR